MQIKIFSIPVVGGEDVNEALNLFLRSKKILQTEAHIVNNNGSAFWSFCVKYLEDIVGASASERTERTKIDYRDVLDEATFKRFSKLREIRKQLAQDDAVPAYAVFTDEELSNIAKLPELSLSKMKTIKGIGDKKVEKYGQLIVKGMTDAQTE